MNPLQGDGQFPPTRWARIESIKSGDEAVAAKALDEICADYYYPLYCYLRRRGCTHHDAQDVLHDFLAGLLRQHALERVEEKRGRLRGYLSTSLGRHLQHWRESEARRGRPVPDRGPTPGSDPIEDRYRLEQFADADTPERIFERKWTVELLELTMHALAQRHEQRGKAEFFEALRPVLHDGGTLRDEDAPALAARLGLSAMALRAALSRLRREYREELRAAVRLTVERDDEVPAELDYLFSLF